MALLKAGWWHTTWWPSRWWHEDWWLEYGVPAGPSYTSYGSPFLYTSANWGSVEFYLEVYMRATSGTAYARLYNETDAAAVTDSELSTAETSMQRLRTSALTLLNGKVYRAQFGKAGADAGAFLGAKLIAKD